MINMTMDMSDNRPLGWTTLEEAKQLIEAGLPKLTMTECPHSVGLI